jgi:uncharacterized integral membrane protein
MDPISNPSDAAGQVPPDDATRTPHGQSRPVPPPSTPPGPVAPAPAPQTPAGTDPKLDEHQGQGVSGGTWIALILGAVILVMLLIFILQNNVPADFAYLGWTFSLPLGIAMLFAAIAGVLVMALFGSVRLFKLGRRVRLLEKERESMRRTLT